MSDDYEKQNAPNEEALMADLDRYLEQAPERFIPQETITEIMSGEGKPSILDIQLAEAAERMYNRTGRRVLDSNGRGPWNPNYAGRVQYYDASVAGRDLQRRLERMSEQGKAAALAAIEDAAQKVRQEATVQAAKILREAEEKAQQIADPPRGMSAEAVDAMIDKALAEASTLGEADRAVVTAVLGSLREAIAALRAVDDPIIRAAVMNLEMAAIGIAKQGNTNGEEALDCKMQSYQRSLDVGTPDPKGGAAVHP